MTANSDLKIVVLCPAKIRTGGPEALFQVCGELASIGFNSQMWLLTSEMSEELEREAAAGRDWTNSRSQLFCDSFIFDEYKRYQVSIFDGHITSKTVFLIPEVYAHWIPFFLPSKPAIWWLSVDNSFQALSRINLNLLRISKIRHFVQSEYAARFVRSLGLKCSPLFDYSTVDTISNGDLLQRDKVLSINAGRKVVFSIVDFERELRKKLPNVEVRRIENLNRGEVYDSFSKSRVFLDFGNFPGNDRMYREAIALGALVAVTDVGGVNSEANYPIPDRYRLRIDEVFSNQTFDLIAHMMLYPDVHRSSFQKLTFAIEAEREVFRQQVLLGFVGGG